MYTFSLILIKKLKETEIQRGSLFTVYLEVKVEFTLKVVKIFNMFWWLNVVTYQWVFKLITTRKGN